MSRPVHFEIHAAAVARALDFYTSVFGWEKQDWSGVAGVPYWGVMTGDQEQPGINGAIMQRAGETPEPGAVVMGAVLTIQVEDVDATIAKALDAGGQVAVEKHAMKGMAWQAYLLDTENNIFGLHQPDPDAA
jgi:predicted enzyme related to lactoylglutathione lyase